ncbi:hypothetical protein D3C71_1738350 [compost metagenome]
MVDDVVYHVGNGHLALSLTHPAERMLSQVGETCTLPFPTVPTLRCGQPLTPCIRVEHLHRLRTDLTRLGGLHSDPGLSHGYSVPSLLGP